MDPTYAVALRIRSMARQMLERFDEAIADLRRAVDLSGGATLYATDLARALAGSGRADEARRILSGLEANAKSRYVGPHGLAAAYGTLGEPDRAFEWMEEAVRQRSHWLTFLEADPTVDPLRADPRLSGIRARVVPL